MPTWFWETGRAKAPVINQLKKRVLVVGGVGGRMTKEKRILTEKLIIMKVLHRSFR